MLTQSRRNRRINAARYLLCTIRWRFNTAHPHIIPAFIRSLPLPLWARFGREASRVSSPAETPASCSASEKAAPALALTPALEVDGFFAGAKALRIDAPRDENQPSTEDQSLEKNPPLVWPHSPCWGRSGGRCR